MRHWRVLRRGFHWEKKAAKAAPEAHEGKIIDRVIVRVRGGHGGAGCNSFAKSINSRHGRVDGGNGGIGGKVLLKCSPEIYDFKGLQHVAAGGDGGHGTSGKHTGKRGKDEVMHVPLGTVVHLSEGTLPEPGYLPPPKNVAKRTVKDRWFKGDEDWRKLSRIFSRDLYSPRPPDPDSDEEAGEEDQEQQLLSDDEEYDPDKPQEDGEEITIRVPRPIIRSNFAELVEPGQSVVVALGGSGGRGNAALPRSLPRKCRWPNGLPRMENEPGDPGSEAVLVLELKSIADTGLVGAPNVGKSTLLGAISRARPFVADYPFTTLRPILGRVEYEDFHSISVADVPGLIEGAHDNRGLGFSFLRHVERTKAFVYVVDASLGVGGRDGPYAWDQLQSLMFEMECYRNGMTKRRSLVVASKIDEEGSEEVVRELRKRTELPVYPVCAVLGEGIDEFKEGLRKMVETDDAPIPDLQELRM